MVDESYWIERAQAAETKLKTLKDAYEPAIERVQSFKATLGLKDRSDGSIVIDYARFVDALGPDGCLELRAEIDKRWLIKGEPGQKPKMTVMA